MKISIPKERLAKLPVLGFTGNIYVIDSMSRMNMAITALRKEPIVGFDSETRPSFFKGKVNKVSLLQIATTDECFLFRLNKIGIPEKLKNFLEDESIKKVGLSIKDDFSAMHRLCEFEPNGFVDLQSLVKNYSIADMSLQRIYAILFGKKISKSQRLSNWEAPELSPAQQQYAALDAITCLEIYNYLNKGMFVPEDSPYIINEENEEEKI